MPYTIYGALESDLKVCYSKKKVIYGLTTVLLNVDIKSNFLDSRLVGVQKAEALIFKKSLLFKHASYLKQGTTIRVQGNLIKTPVSAAIGNAKFTDEEIDELQSDCILILDRASSLIILSSHIISNQEHVEEKNLLKLAKYSP